jgi:hypothetical protein
MKRARYEKEPGTLQVQLTWAQASITEKGCAS